MAKIKVIQLVISNEGNGYIIDDKGRLWTDRNGRWERLKLPDEPRDRSIRNLPYIGKDTK